MPEIIISTQGTTPADVRSMPRDVALHCLRLVAEDTERYCTLRMDSVQPPDYLPEMIEVMQQGLLRAVFTLDPQTDVATWRLLRDVGFKIRMGCQSSRFARLVMPAGWQGDWVDEICLWMERPEQCTVNGKLDGLKNLRTVAIGLGWSDHDSGPHLPPPDEGQAWAAGLVPLVRDLSRQGFEVRFLCGLPLCMLDRNTLGDLAALRVRWPIATCPLDMVIHPSGEVRPCPRLRPGAGKEINVMDFDSLARLSEAVSGRSQKLRALCQYDQTLSCVSQRTAACQGACLAMADWKGQAS